MVRQNRHIINKNIINELVSLTKFCMNQNVFQFNNTFFEQTDGTTIENPLSFFLAVVFMSRF